MNKCIVLMPASQYRMRGLYENVADTTGVDSHVFKGIRIGCRLSLAEVHKDKIYKYKYPDILLACSDGRFYEYYKWNIEHDRNIVVKHIDDALPEALEWLSTDLDFIENNRCCKGSGSGFGLGGYGYKFNVTKTGLDISPIQRAFCIHFNTKLAKDNFTKWWYKGSKGNALASRATMGLAITTLTRTVSFFIPQIDWETIHINQKELWDKDLYDDAVLSEMGLCLKDGAIVKC